jgi:peptidoglycan/LPS O-acetylase OafA/YrhL
MNEILFLFVASLVGASIGSTLIPSRRRPPLTATLMEIVALAVVIVVPQATKVLWPELPLVGHAIVAATAVVLIYSPVSYWTSRMRARMRKAA